MAKERIYLVTQSKRGENVLGYALKTKEYVYLHKGKEIWREKGDENLFNYFNEVMEGYRILIDEDIKDNPIWKKYGESCHKFELEEWKRMGI